MADRNVYGLDFSENGWRMVDQGSCVWVKVPGTDGRVSLQIREGQPAQILGAWAADWNAYIEPLRDADSACWTATNSVASSNHLSGTAIDLNWDSHPFQVLNAGFDAAQLATMGEMLDFYEEMVFWGNNWDSPKDAMHSQMNGDTYGSENVGRVQDFINRKIRADGFSTFRRGAGPVIPPAAQVLAAATGLSLDRATEILPTVTSGLHAADCTNVNRIAMWLAQCGEESAGFSTTEEFASGAEYEGRCSDLGNCSPGDGVKYKGRTWIQITGKAHYQEFSQWAFSKGLIGSPTQFVDDPASLGDLRWAGIGAAWYWTVSRPDINALSDAGDVVTVTHRINGGEHGLADRQNRYARAHTLGDQLLALTTDTPPPGDDMALVPQDQWDNFYRAYMSDVPSLSPLRHLGEGNIGPIHQILRNIDGSEHVEVVQLLASLGHPPSIALLQEIAAADPVTHPDRQGDAKLAQAILADLTSAPAPVTAPAQMAAPLPVAPPRIVYVDRPAPAPAPAADLVERTGNGTQSTGQIIGEAYDALEKLRLADALPIESRAPLAALIAVLQTKNGSQV